MYFCLKLEA